MKKLKKGYELHKDRYDIKVSNLFQYNSANELIIEKYFLNTIKITSEPVMEYDTQTDNIDQFFQVGQK